MRGRFEKPESCIIMMGFDGECYIFNEENRDFVETDKIGGYAIGLIDGKRRYKEIVDAVCEKYAGNDLESEEISRKLTETFEAAIRIGAIKKKFFPW